MSVNVPTQFTELNLGDYITSSEALADDWTALVENANYLWAVDIAHLDGHAWDPAFEVTSTSFVQDDTTDNRNLDQLLPYSRLRRRVDSSNTGTANAVIFHGAAFISNCDLRWSVFRLDDDQTETRIGQKTRTVADGSWDWVDFYFFFTDDEVSDSSLISKEFAPIRHRLEMRVETDGNPARLYQADGWEGMVETAAEVPTTV